MKSFIIYIILAIDLQSEENNGASSWQVNKKTWLQPI